MIILQAVSFIIFLMGATVLWGAHRAPGGLRLALRIDPLAVGVVALLGLNGLIRTFI